MEPEPTPVSSSPAALVRLLVPTVDLTAARHISDTLEADELAPPLALTLFERLPGTGWRVDAYFEAGADLAALRATLSGVDGVAGEISVELVPDENWVAVSQAALPPVAAGRLLVHGSHDRDRVGRRHFALLIDAGEAFGTAHHATTEGCLIALDRLAATAGGRFRRVLDLGCGSGVLAMAAARLMPRARVLASDIDPVAVEVARANVALNGGKGRVRTLAAPGLAHERVRASGPYDLILANILAGPLITLAPAMARAVRPGATVVLSGILADQAREVIGTYAAAGFRLASRRIRNGWATLVLRRLART